MPKVSVVIPVYGVENYIAKCMKSLLDQTISDFVVYIVDDGSKDNSIKIAKEITKNDQRFVFLEKENGGLSDARNLGLNYVSSEYVMFVDSDDFVEPDFIEKALIAVEGNDIAVFGYNMYYGDGIIEKNKTNINNGIYELSKNKELLAYSSNAAWNKIYKTSLFKDNSIEYPKGLWYEDLGTTPKLFLKAKKIAYIDDCLYNYLSDRPNNISTTVNKKVLHIVKILDNVISYYKDNNSFEEYYNELQYLAMRNFIKALRLVINSSDRELISELSSEIFSLKKKYFKRKCKYEYCLEKGDFIYTNKLTFGLYRLLKRR